MAGLSWICFVLVVVLCHCEEHSDVAIQLSTPHPNPLPQGRGSKINNKKSNNRSYRSFYGVDKVTILEPNNNIYHRIVSVMKQSTQEYCNMRMVLGLKVA